MNFSKISRSKLSHAHNSGAKIYRSEGYNNCQMHELMFQAGVKGMRERSELIPCIHYNNTTFRSSGNFRRQNIFVHAVVYEN